MGCLFGVVYVRVFSATLIVRSGGLFWLKLVAMVLLMVCSVVLVELRWVV